MLVVRTSVSDSRLLDVLLRCEALSDSVSPDGLTVAGGSAEDPVPPGRPLDKHLLARLHREDCPQPVLHVEHHSELLPDRYAQPRPVGGPRKYKSLMIL